MARPSSRLDLIVRADATELTGAGHVMRCVNLMEAWDELDLGYTSLWGNVTIPFAVARLRATSARLVEAHQSPDDTGTILVVDTYHSDERSELATRPGPALRVLVDDLGGSVPKGFDVIWNPNAYGSPELYQRFSGVVISGADAVPVRGNLPRWCGHEASTVGVTLGGGRISEDLRAALECLGEAASPETFVGVGEWTPAFWRRVGADDPWSTLAGCGRLITAGGSTVWEAAAVGIPVAVVKTTANQAHLVEWVRRQNVPTVDSLAAENSGTLSARLRHALADARPLPPIRSAAENVACRLVELAVNASGS